MSRRLLALALPLAALLGPGPRALGDEAEDLRNDAWRAAGTSAGALVLEALVARVKTPECRICSAGKIDESVRDALRWSDTAAAQRTSDVLANLAIPALALGDAYRSTSSWGNFGRDVLVVTEAASLTTLSTTIAKAGFARRRPGVPPGSTSSSDNHSLWSGHSSFAFSVVVAQAMQDTLRGDDAAPWAWAIGLTLAGTVGYLRIAGQAHWLTDVLAGAAVGSGFGVAVPLLEKRLVHGVTLSAAPGGIALHF